MLAGCPGSSRSDLGSSGSPHIPLWQCVTACLRLALPRERHGAGGRLRPLKVAAELRHEGAHCAQVGVYELKVVIYDARPAAQRHEGQHLRPGGRRGMTRVSWGQSWPSK